MEVGELEKRLFGRTEDELVGWTRDQLDQRYKFGLDGQRNMLVNFQSRNVTGEARLYSL
jgi:hypothetical protein